MTDDNDELARRPGDAIAPSNAAIAAEEELPVVARLVVEIRSDGTRTIARGAMSDVESGQSVAVELRSGSPWQMAQSLVKALLSMPKLVVNARKAIGRTRG